MSLGADDSQDAVERWAKKLDRIEDKLVDVTKKSLERSLNGLMGDLKKSYVRYKDSNGDSGAKAARVQAQRLGEVIAVSEEFFTDDEMRTWEKRVEKFLYEADDLGQELETVVQEAESSSRIRQGVREQIVAAAASATTWLDYENENTRKIIVSSVTEGVARGWGPKKLAKEIVRRTGGAIQKAELVARTEMSTAYLEGQRRMAKRLGADYVRWVATEDERTCPYCASRSGLIFSLSEVVMPAHPLCRCSMVPVPNELVEKEDAELLDEKSWGEHREQVAAEYLLKKAKAFPNAKPPWTIDRMLRQFDEYRVKPTGFERQRNPNISDEGSARPMRVLGAEADSEIKWHR